MKHKRLLIGVSAVAIVVGGGAIMLAPLAEEPNGLKDCGPAVAKGLAGRLVARAASIPIHWLQRGGTINDASCLNRTPVAGIVAVHSEADVANALAYARTNKLTVSAAGVRHSMGGHAFQKDGLVLDMRGMDSIKLDPVAHTVTVGAGATWHAIQNAIHPDFAVKAMQSTDIFSVGGSISVNAHGMDHRAGAVMRSIRSLRLMLADGRIVTASPTENSDLFRHVVGGYGLFGILLSADLEVVPNDIYQSGRILIDYRQFPATFAKLEADPAIGLTYTHLSTAPDTLLREALVYTYRKVPDDKGLTRAPLGDVSATKLRRLTVNLSKRNDTLKAFKWWSEKNLEHRMESCTVTRAQAMKDGEACLVSRNDPMHDSVPYLYNALKDETDILQEYFVPRDRLIPFIDGMRAIFAAEHANLVNASIRAVDTESNALSYAPAPAFSVVLYLNQKADDAGNAAMARLTSDLIDLSTRNGGRFFLPYQLYYTPQQLHAAYPEIDAFFAEKKKWDPDGLFSNSWYKRYGPAASAPS